MAAAAATSLLSRTLPRRHGTSIARVIAGSPHPLTAEETPLKGFTPHRKSRLFSSSSATTADAPPTTAQHDLAVSETAFSTPSKHSSKSSNDRLSLFDMDAIRIRGLTQVDEIEALISQLERLEKLTAADIGPLLIPLSHSVSKLSDTDLYKRALLVERILFACLKQLPSSLEARNEQSPYPTATLYNRVIIAWGDTKTLEGAQRAERILQLMITEYNNEPERSAAPDRRCFKSTVRAWAVAKAEPGAREPASQGLDRAYELLGQMEDHSSVSSLLNENHVKQALYSFTMDPPDRMTYNTVMASFARAFVSKEPHALDRIKSIVSRMDKLYSLTENPEYQLDGYSFHAILRAYSRYVAYGSEDSLPVDYANEIQAIIFRLFAEGKADELSEHADLAWVYGVMVEALVKTHPILDHIPQAHEYILALAGRPGHGIPIYRTRVWPRHASIMKVVRAWERIRHQQPLASEKINELVDLAVTAPYERVFFLNQAMEEWIESGWEFAPELIEMMLSEAMNKRHRTNIKPTGQTFLVAIKAWLRSRSDEAPHRAELIFQSMLQIFLENKDGFYTPREQHVRLVMTAWLSKCQNGRRYKGTTGLKYPAEHIEALLLSLKGYDWLKNVPGQYAMALRAWAIQKVGAGPDEPNPIERLKHVLDQLEQIEQVEKLPAYPCNYVIEGCRRKSDTVERRQQAYTLAVETFGRSRRNARTFVLMAQVIKRQVRDLDENHIQSIESLFQECCNAGMLTQDMIWEVIEVATVESLQKLFGVSRQYADGIMKVRNGQLINTTGSSLNWKGTLPNGLQCRNLPHSWHCNASIGLQG